MISARLVDAARCPDCRGTLRKSTTEFQCTGCGRRFDATAGYLDLRPLSAFDEQTKYLDDALHADARHASVAPPLLGSKVRNDRLRSFLQLGPDDRVLDLGCGSGRTLIWNGDSGATLAGLDISPFFAHEAIDRCDLLLGDLRRLPLADGTFTKAWSLDVLEHLSPAALRDMLKEANRVLADRGVLFVYTHVRKNGAIAGLVRLVNRFARLCERIGLIDLRQERLRKSDHLNPLANHADLERVMAECGFQIDRITYYTPVFGAIIENVIVRIAERALTRRAARAAGVEADSDAAAKAARSQAQARVRRRGPTYLVLRAMTAIMQLDVWLFGRMQSGPFFAAVRKIGPASSA